MENADLSGTNWKNGQPQYKANGCLRVFFPLIARKIGNITPPPPSIEFALDYFAN
jgi:hypothetical protein